jgi:hypothetical protein
MSPLFTRAASLAVVMLCGAAAAGAQPAPGPAQPPRDTAVMPVNIQVVISRFQGDKKVSSLPYALAVNANGNRASLRIGANVPVETVTINPQNSQVPVSSFHYQNVGIAIDCGATSLDGGRYRVDLTVDDSSVYGDQTAEKREHRPTFRSFKSTNSLVLREGQTSQFTMATDKVTGEVIRVEVSLTVLK